MCARVRQKRRHRRSCPFLQGGRSASNTRNAENASAHKGSRRGVERPFGLRRSNFNSTNARSAVVCVPESWFLNGKNRGEATDGVDRREDSPRPDRKASTQVLFPWSLLPLDVPETRQALFSRLSAPESPTAWHFTERGDTRGRHRVSWIWLSRRGLEHTEGIRSESENWSRKRRRQAMCGELPREKRR